MDKEDGIKPNFSDVARRYGVDRHTVAKYWNKGDAAPDDGRHARKSGFDRYREEIEEKAQIPGVTAKGIHELLLERHAHDTPPVPGYNAFTNYLRTRGIIPGGQATPEAHPRFETAPGEQLQFDWKEDITMHDRDGREYRFDVFTSTLGWSRLHYFVRSPTKTRDDLLACMADNIRRLGGVPREWLTDNMSAIATFHAEGRRSKDRRVLAFAKEAGFRLVLCRPHTPETKGKDESANRFLTRLLAYDGDFQGWEGLDAAIARICRRSNEEPNRTTGLPPELLFRQEKEALLPPPKESVLSALVGDVSWQVVPPTMLVPCRGRAFSVPRGCIGHKVKLIVTPEGQLRIYDSGKLVATHDTRAKGGPIVYRKSDYLEAMADKRWGGADGDIEVQAQRNLELLDRLGEGEE